jgi:nitroimidazol reductase NimA-like FMN-containing flavoprotein (pyridoxamine 5'-phosphate oxidase superfamily)
MSHVHPAAELVDLDRAECLRLLAETRFGRLAVTVGEDRPVIRPVNYVFDEPSQCVVFRTSPGTKLHALMRAKRAAFEIDEVDASARTGWSVIIDGIIEEVTSTIERRRLDTLAVDVWAPGERDHWCRLRTWAVSGRRIEQPDASRSPGP